MSLSNLSDNADAPAWGTIFMGPEPMRETTLSRIEGANSGSLWNDETEAEYLERVKERATQKAAQILRDAQAEAAALREQARKEGYEQGINDAQAELDEFRTAAAQTTTAVLSAIESQADALTKAWENELCGLVRAAVEAGIGYELNRHRAEILKALFFEAVNLLSKEKKAVIFTNPEDSAIVAEIVATAGEDYAARFQVRGNPGLTPGSIVLESSLGLVENNLESRRAMVERILSELVLSEQVEQVGEAAEPAVSAQAAGSPAEQPTPAAVETAAAQSPTNRAAEPQKAPARPKQAMSRPVSSPASPEVAATVAQQKQPVAGKAAASSGAEALVAPAQSGMAPQQEAQTALPAEPELGEEALDFGSLIPPELLNGDELPDAAGASASVAESESVNKEQ